MVETTVYLDELIQQINILKITYGNYLNLKKTLNALYPKEKSESEQEYAIKLMRKFDEEKNELINQIVSSFSNAATFVVMEVESLKENLPEKDVRDLNESYKEIELNARPSIEQAKKFVQAANNLKVKLSDLKTEMESNERVNHLSH